jgi:hypothetical protein
MAAIPICGNLQRHFLKADAVVSTDHPKPDRLRATMPDTLRSDTRIAFVAFSRVFL